MGRAANAIVKALQKSSFWNGKEGAGSNIVVFSDTDAFPEPPYVVVKPEAGSVAGTRQFRIIAHCAAGEAPLDRLEDFTLVELDKLLLGGIEDEGSRFYLHAGGYTDVTPEGDDGTYFMERIYYVPLGRGA